MKEVATEFWGHCIHGAFFTIRLTRHYGYPITKEQLLKMCKYGPLFDLIIEILKPTGK